MALVAEAARGDRLRGNRRQRQPVERSRDHGSRRLYRCPGDVSLVLETERDLAGDCEKVEIDESALPKSRDRSFLWRARSLLIPIARDQVQLFIGNNRSGSRGISASAKTRHCQAKYESV